MDRLEATTRETERTIYSRGNILVTHARVVLDDTTYPVGQISAVAVRGPDLRVCIGLTLFAVCAVLDRLRSSDWVGAAICAIFATLGAMYGMRENGYAFVVLGTSGAQVRALRAPRAVTNEIVQAITDALVARSR